MTEAVGFRILGFCGLWVEVSCGEFRIVCCFGMFDLSGSVWAGTRFYVAAGFVYGHLIEVDQGCRYTEAEIRL